MVKFSPEMGSVGHEKDLSDLNLANTDSGRDCSWVFVWQVGCLRQFVAAGWLKHPLGICN